MNKMAHYGKKIIDFRTPILQGKTPVFSIAYRVPRPEEFEDTLCMVRQRMFELGHPDERYWDDEKCVNSSAHFTDHPLRYTYSNVPTNTDPIYYIGIQNGGISKRLTQQIMQPEGRFFTATFIAPTLRELGFRQGEIIKEVHPDEFSLISAERRIYAHLKGIDLRLSMEDLGYIKYSDFFDRLRQYGFTSCNSQIISPMLHFMGVDYHSPERTVIIGDHLFSDNGSRSNDRFLLMHHIKDAIEVDRIKYGRYDIPIHQFNFIDTSPSGFSTEKVPAFTETYAQMLNGKPFRNISYGLGSFLDLRVLLQVDPLSCPKAEQLIGLNQVQVPGVENVSVGKLLTDGHTSIGSSLGSREKIQIKL